jgi:hypothetical protein
MMTYRVSTLHTQDTVNEYDMVLHMMSSSTVSSRELQRRFEKKMEHAKLSELDGGRRTYGFMGTVGKEGKQRMAFKLMEHNKKSSVNDFRSGYALVDRSKKKLYERMLSYFDQVSDVVTRNFFGTIVSVNGIAFDLAKMQSLEKFYDNSFLSVLFEFFIMLNGHWFTIAQYMFGK